MTFLFAPPAQPVIPVQDERYDFFPIHRVYGAAKITLPLTKSAMPRRDSVRLFS